MKGERLIHSQKLGSTKKLFKQKTLHKKSHIWSATSVPDTIFSHQPRLVHGRYRDRLDDQSAKLQMRQLPANRRPVQYHGPVHQRTKHVKWCRCRYTTELGIDRSQVLIKSLHAGDSSRSQGAATNNDNSKTVRHNRQAVSSRGPLASFDWPLLVVCHSGCKSQVSAALNTYESEGGTWPDGMSRTEMPDGSILCKATGFSCELSGMATKYKYIMALTQNALRSTKRAPRVAPLPTSPNLRLRLFLWQMAHWACSVISTASSVTSSCPPADDRRSFGSRAPLFIVQTNWSV